jgi:hypothetical protein
LLSLRVEKVMISWFKKRFIKKLFFEVAANDSKCIMTPLETIDCLRWSDDPKEYTVVEKFMTQAEYDALPEFNGF